MPHDRHSKRPRKSEPVRNAGLQLLSRSRLSGTDSQSAPHTTAPKSLSAASLVNSVGRRPPRRSIPSRRDRSTLRSHRSISKRNACLSASDSSMSDVSEFPDSSSRSRHYSIRDIKRAKDRMEKYKLKSDPKIHEQLLRECDADKRKYIEKMKSRDPTRSEDDFVTGLEELLRRQRDIDRGKSSDIYQQYVNAIAKVDREVHHPRTPNKFRKVSRRAWDGMVKKWRLSLYNYETLDPDEPYKTDVSLMEDAEDVEEDEASVSVLSSPWTAPRHPVEAEEDTLQGGSKRAAAVVATDDNTLDGSETRLSLRGRRVLMPPNRFTPSPDELHTGLTNDINAMVVVKRSRNDSRDGSVSAIKKRKSSQ
ncbi:hypothetical protein Aperf_G00000127635 [Anoplocephala perfoliata]